MGPLKMNVRTAMACGCMVVLLWLASSGDGFSQHSEAERNYQRFLAVYRQDNPTKSELKNALSFLETANLLAPNNYKYVFSLGALKTTLGNWQEAAEWLEKAESLADTKEQRELIQSELEYCCVQMAKAKVSGYGGPGISISFMMKEGTVEMDADTIAKLPQRLPAVNAGDSVQELLGKLESAIGGPASYCQEARPLSSGA